MIKILFFSFMGLIIYTYLIYPLILLLLAAAIPKSKVKQVAFLPSVSLIISVYNEEKVIEEKIKNCLELDYPKDKLEVIIGSDGSTDETDNIVRKYSFHGIKLCRFDHRNGKVNVLNNIIPQAIGKIVVLSDGNTMYEPQAIKELVNNFDNENVGCVCGKLLLKNSNGGFGGEIEGLYWKYENYLKKIEGRMGFLLGANGGIYAIRKKLFKTLPPDAIVDDFIIPMRILERGYKVLYEERAIAFEEASKSISEESVRKTRIGAGDYQALLLTLPMLNIFRGIPSVAYWSHKVIRWFVPFLLMLLLVTNIFLLKEKIFNFLFFSQIAFYFCGLIGYVTNKYKYQIKIFLLPYYFIAMNFSLLIGFLKFLIGKQKVTWEKVPR